MTKINKIKWILMISAILLGIGGAILTRPASKTHDPFYAAGGCMSMNADLPPQSSTDN